MIVWLVIPAHGRLAVSKVAFAGYRWLIDQLAVRGITCRALVIADDGNLEMAHELGFDTLERPNVLGDKLNDGFEHAAALGADWICFTGSDNWLHPDIFDLQGDAVITGEGLTMVDLSTGRAGVIREGLREGLPPWLIPTATLAACRFRPIPNGEPNGIEGHLLRSLRGTEFRRGGSATDRVDFKSDGNMTSYTALRRLITTEHDAWKLLAGTYPSELVAKAHAAAFGTSVARATGHVPGGAAFAGSAA